MKTVDVQGADFPALVDEAAAGEEIIFEKEGKPVARLTPVNEFSKAFGALKGKIWIDEEHFDDPLPPDLLKAFGMEE